MNRILIKEFVSTNKCTIENFSTKLKDLVEKVNNDLSKIKNLIKEKKNNILNLSNKKVKKKKLNFINLYFTQLLDLFQDIFQMVYLHFLILTFYQEY